MLMEWTMTQKKIDLTRPIQAYFSSSFSPHVHSFQLDFGLLERIKFECGSIFDLHFTIRCQFWQSETRHVRFVYLANCICVRFRTHTSTEPQTTSHFLLLAPSESLCISIFETRWPAPNNIFKSSIGYIMSLVCALHVWLSSTVRYVVFCVFFVFFFFHSRQFLHIFLSSNSRLHLQFLLFDQP